MGHTRRSLLKGVSGVALASIAIPGYHARTGSASGPSRASLPVSPGTALSVGVADDGTLSGFSDELALAAVRDPTGPGGQGRGRDDQDGQGRGEGQGRGRGRGQENAVVRITSYLEDYYSDDEQAMDATPDPVTNDYAFSLANVQKQDLTPSELADAGLSYEWFVTGDDTINVGEDEEKSGVGPGEVWLVLQEPDAGGNDLLSNLPRILFRTEFADEGTGAWNTRDVGDELRDGAAWEEITTRGEIRTVSDPATTYSDLRVLAVGIGRGGTLDGPSRVDTYYRNLTVSTNSYPFPIIASVDDVFFE